MKILIVEDDHKIADCIVDAVMGLRIPYLLIEPVKCDNVADALALISTPGLKFDAVVLDMGLPERPGCGIAPKGGVWVWKAIRRLDVEKSRGDVKVFRNGKEIDISVRANPITPIVINTGLEMHQVGNQLDRYTRYSNKDVMIVVRHLEEMLN